MREQSLPAGRGGAADVVYVLCLLQTAFIVVPAVGEVGLMGGNPLYLVVPLAKVVVLLVLATKVVKARRWALISMIVVQAVTLFGFWLQLGAGLLPWVDFTLNLVVLVTNLALPVALIWMCAVLLASTRPAVPASSAQDPFAPAPLVTTAYPELEVTG